MESGSSVGVTTQEANPIKDEPDAPKQPQDDTSKANPDTNGQSVPKVNPGVESKQDKSPEPDQTAEHSSDDESDGDDGETEARNTRALRILLAVIIVNTAVQFTMAMIGNSLSILGDAIAEGVDCLSYLFNLIAERQAKKKKWLPHCSAVVSMILLIGVCIFVIVTASAKLDEHSDDVEPGTMVIGGCVNLTADLIGMAVLYYSNGLWSHTGDANPDDAEAHAAKAVDKGRKHNMRSAFVHVLADSFRACAIITVGIIGLVDSDHDMDHTDAATAIALSGVVMLMSFWEIGAASFSWREVVKKSRRIKKRQAQHMCVHQVPKEMVAEARV